MLGIIGAGTWHTRFADRAERLARWVEHLHLVAGAAIAQVDIADGIEGHLLGVLQPVGDNDFGRGELGGPDAVGQGVARNCLPEKT